MIQVTTVKFATLGLGSGLRSSRGDESGFEDLGTAGHSKGTYRLKIKVKGIKHRDPCASAVKWVLRGFSVQNARSEIRCYPRRQPNSRMDVATALSASGSFLCPFPT